MVPDLPPFCKIYRAMSSARKVSELIASDLGFRKDLCGVCAFGAIVLHRALKIYNLETYLAVSTNGVHGHVYVWYNKYILDVTATQFRKSKILITYFNDVKHSIPWAYGIRLFRQETELITYLAALKWDATQIPTSDKLNKYTNTVIN